MQAFIKINEGNQSYSAVNLKIVLGASKQTNKSYFYFGFFFFFNFKNKAQAIKKILDKYVLVP